MLHIYLLYCRTENFKAQIYLETFFVPPAFLGPGSRPCLKKKIKDPWLKGKFLSNQNNENWKISGNK
jgi:hypothetical protein